MFAKPTRFSQTCQRIQNAHPLPSERLQNITRNRLAIFLSDLRMVPPIQLKRWIGRLSPEKLALVFEAIATTSDENTLNRLFLILQQRAGWTLYQYGWKTVQNRFPEPNLLRAFRYLCHILKKQGTLRPHHLEEDVCADWIQAKDPEDCFERLLSHLRDIPATGLEEIRCAYSYSSNTLLWQLLLGQYFRICSDPDLYRGRTQLTDLLPSLHPAQVESILRRIPESEALTVEQKNAVARYILQGLPILTPPHPTWKELQDRNLYRYFRRLAVTLCLQEHCAGQEEKLRFYSSHFVRILDIARLSDQALALRFPQFILVDHVNLPRTLYYYSNEGVEAFLRSGREQEELASPDFPLLCPGLDGSAEELAQEPGLRLELLGQPAREAQILLNRKLGEQLVARNRFPRS